MVYRSVFIICEIKSGLVWDNAKKSPWGIGNEQPRIPIREASPVYIEFKSSRYVQRVPETFTFCEWIWEEIRQYNIRSQMEIQEHLWQEVNIRCQPNCVR